MKKWCELPLGSSMKVHILWKIFILKEKEHHYISFILQTNLVGYQYYVTFMVYLKLITTINHILGHTLT
jgi:hypothetical protein